MANDGAPKSAIELAMERLRKKDEAAGITTRALTDAEKAAIGDGHGRFIQALKRVFDPAEREEVERQFRREKEHLASERDAKIEKIRQGAG